MLPSLLEYVGASAFIHVEGEELSALPKNWTGRELALVKGGKYEQDDFRFLHGRGVLLVNADLRGCNLEGADLMEADLRGANLFGANMSGVLLKHANLQGANLAGANLAGAMLDGADLLGAELMGARGVTPGAIRRAANWDKATYGWGVPAENLLRALGLPEDHDQRLRRLLSGGSY